MKIRENDKERKKGKEANKYEERKNRKPNSKTTIQKGKYQ